MKSIILKPSKKTCAKILDELWEASSMSEMAGKKSEVAQLDDVADIVVDYLGFQHPKDETFPASQKRLAEKVHLN